MLVFLLCLYFAMFIVTFYTLDRCAGFLPVNVTLPVILLSSVWFFTIPGVLLHMCYSALLNR